MKRLFLGITVALVVVGVTLSGSHPSLAVTQVDTARFFVNEASLPFNALAGTSTTRYWGITNGAGWRIEVPDNWNGDLVLYAHGFAGTGDLLAVQNPGIRAHLIAKGYAWAASSYRANGYVPGTGAEDTYDLLKIFKQVVSKDGKKGKFKRVYLYGVSMGGHVVGHMIEKWRNSFAGALPVCGVMGDNELFDFFQDMYLLAETLVGNTPIVPTPADYYTNPAQGWQVTRTLLGASYPSGLTTAGTAASSRSSRIFPGATGRSTTRALSGLPVEPSHSTSARPSPAPAVKTSIPSTSSTPTRRCRRQSSSSTTP